MSFPWLPRQSRCYRRLSASSPIINSERLLIASSQLLKGTQSLQIGLCHTSSHKPHNLRFASKFCWGQMLCKWTFGITSNSYIDILDVEWLFEAHSYIYVSFRPFCQQKWWGLFQLERPCLIMALRGHLFELFELTPWWLHSNMGSISVGQPRLFESLPIHLLMGPNSAFSTIAYPWVHESKDYFEPASGNGQLPPQFLVASPKFQLATSLVNIRYGEQVDQMSEIFFCKRWEQRERKPDDNSGGLEKGWVKKKFWEG